MFFLLRWCSSHPLSKFSDFWSPWQLTPPRVPSREMKSGYKWGQPNRNNKKQVEKTLPHFLSMLFFLFSILYFTILHSLNVTSSWNEQFTRNKRLRWLAHLTNNFLFIDYFWIKHLAKYSFKQLVHRGLKMQMWHRYLPPFHFFQWPLCMTLSIKEVYSLLKARFIHKRNLHRITICKNANLTIALPAITNTQPVQKLVALTTNWKIRPPILLGKRRSM